LARNLRVYELARHYGVDSKAITVLLKKMKAEVKSHMSVVEDDLVDKVHTVFQRKRELARINYAKAHGLDPDKLKHVASLKPLPKPEPAPEPKKKATKKKVAKKKKGPAKPKVVVIKKAGTKTAVARQQEARRKAAAQVAADKKAAEHAERDAQENERAIKREKSAQLRRKARLVKKDQVVAEAEVVAEAAAADTEVTEPVADADAATEVAAVAETAAPVETPQAAAEPTLTEPPAVVDPDQTDQADQADQVGRKNDGFKVGDIVRPASETPPVAAKPKVSKESVKESVKAAIRKRVTERAAQETLPRTKRRRVKKKKVDEAEVARQLKQTMAQLETGAGKRRRRKGGQIEADEQSEEVVKITEFITVQDFAEKLDVPARDIITRLLGLGVMATMNQRLDREYIDLLAEEYERDVEFLSEYGEEILEEQETPVGDLVHRPPVVTVMGHVDHGKTSLLDKIRATNVIAGEAGGITQHIGAYTVATPGGPITFLDTPGHAAFTAMRARGAQVTDIVILVVAANDGVMPQTVEAINHAKVAGVPIIVAINKIDLADAKPDRVKQELMQHDIVIEEFGGEILSAEISAKQGLNLDKMLELVHLQAEVLELTASPKGNARGVVIEARKEPGRGVVFSLLVEKGTLSVGDIFLVGMQHGRVRGLVDERGEKLVQVEPGQPAEVLGAADVPEAGDRFYVLGSEREARDIANKRKIQKRQQQLTSPKKKISLDNLAEMMSSGDLKELPIIIKGDVAGSVEALADQLLELNTAEVQVKIVHKAVGAISESDVLLADGTGAMILGFHLRPGVAIKDLANAHNVNVEVFDIIYEAVDTLKKAMAGLLSAIEREVSTGRAEVREVFRIPKVGQIAGSFVLDGKIVRNGRARLVREEVVVFEGKISSLKRFKDDAKEVAQGYECGIGLENFHEIQPDDVIEAYEIEKVARTEL